MGGGDQANVGADLEAGKHPRAALRAGEARPRAVYFRGRSAPCARGEALDSWRGNGITATEEGVYRALSMFLRAGRICTSRYWGWRGLPATYPLKGPLERGADCPVKPPGYLNQFREFLNSHRQLRRAFRMR